MALHSDPARPAGRRRPGLRRRDLAFATLLLIAAGVLATASAGARATVAATHAAAVQSRSATTYEGLAEAKPLPEPALALRNYLGQRVSITSYRGKAVLVTFIYTHCPDICPLIVSHLHTALTQMPASERSRLQIVAVSVDPRGDTPRAVAQFLKAHEMTGLMQYLVGSASALEPVWRTWGIDAAAVAKQPDAVDHTALIYGITAHRKVAVVYPSNFAPGEIVHDAALLERS